MRIPAMVLSCIIFCVPNTALAQDSSSTLLVQLEKEMGKIEVVDIDTNQGTIELALYADKAPLTVQNFLGYAEEGFYDNTIIHRVIRDFIIQGGGLTAEFTVKPVKDAIKSEARNGLKNRRGTIAMARTGVIDSATTQFFINLKDNSSLDHRNDTVEGYGYAVFGEVIAGLEIVDRIAAIPTGEKLLDPENKRGLYVDVPVETVVVKTIKRKTISR